MRAPRSRVGGLAQAGLVPVAGLAVHQLRYWLAYGDAARVVLARQGHTYLTSLAPWLVVLAALAFGGFLRALARAMSGRRSARGHIASFGSLWLVTFAGLVALYAAQEGLEGMLAAGHPGGFAGIFGAGGLWALPAAVCVGLVLAATIYGARTVLVAIASRCGAAASRCTAVTPRRRPGAGAPRRLAPVAAGWSDRGPPAVA